MSVLQKHIRPPSEYSVIYLGWAGGPPPLGRAGLVLPLAHRAHVWGQSLARSPSLRAVLGLTRLQRGREGEGGGRVKGLQGRAVKGVENMIEGKVVR